MTPEQRAARLARKAEESEEIASALAKIPKIDLIQPTAEERMNGWTAETLTRYMRERQLQKESFLLSQKKTRVVRVENCETFDPFRW